MRILQLAKWLSPRQDSGGKLRATGLASALARFAEVDVIGYRRPGEDPLDGTPALAHYRSLYPVDVEKGAARAFTIAANFGRGYALRSCRFRSAAYRDRVAERLAVGAYDAIQVEEMTILANLEPDATSLPIVYSAHNVESDLAPILMRGKGRVLGRLAAFEVRRTSAEERRALERARFCLAVSENDKAALERLAWAAGCPVRVIANCVDDAVVPDPPVARTPGGGEAVCIACFRWSPNDRGARWFLAEVLPHLRRAAARSSVRFVGSEMSSSLRDAIRAAGCLYDADVPSTLPYLHRARAAIVPLLDGGGTRLKIVEAWAAGVPVVTTPIGAQGLACTGGVDVLLASDALTFADAVRRVLEDDTLYGRLRENGLRRAEPLRWARLAPVLEPLYRSLLDRKGAA
jgi:glycosyltransferase involved in cell wall biosynthesis